MGNANGRDDDTTTTTTTTSSESEDDENSTLLPYDDGGGGGGDPLATPPPELSITPSTHSPFLFTPQVPVVPLQRPDEMHAPTHSWMQTTSGYEDMYGEQGIPTMIAWSFGGKEVAVEGSWDNWKIRIPLQRSGKDFTIMKVLPSGVYQYRYIVDGQWRYTPDLPWALDDAGNAYNILDLQDRSAVESDKIMVFWVVRKSIFERGRKEKDYVPEDIGSISSFEPPQSPDSSYNNLELSPEDYAKEPPVIPPHLQMTLLNVPATNMEIQPPMSRPQHGVLNHLYMQKGKSSPSVVALGTTHRFLAKYVTVVLYKSLQR